MRPFLYPKKSLGQNFLIDNNIIKKIIKIGELNLNSIVIEIGPGKVLTGLVKRIDKNVESYSINNDEDIKKININD